MSNFRADAREMRRRKYSQLRALGGNRLHRAMVHPIKLEESIGDAGSVRAIDI